MGMHTVTLDEEAEKTLARLRKSTGLPISEMLKRGLDASEQRVRREGEARPYDIYRRLDLGPGGWSVGPAREVKRRVREVLRRKRAR